MTQKRGWGNCHYCPRVFGDGGAKGEWRIVADLEALTYFTICPSCLRKKQLEERLEQQRRETDEESGK